MSTNGLVYAMGAVPGKAIGYSIIGVHERTIYRDNPGRIMVHEYGELTGSPTTQVISLMAIASEFHPLVIACQSFDPHKQLTSPEYLAPVSIGARIQFCVDTHYTFAKLVYQTTTQAVSVASDSNLKLWGLYTDEPEHIQDSTRHAITFIRRAKQDHRLRDSAWGPEPSHRIAERKTASRSVNGRARPARRLY